MEDSTVSLFVEALPGIWIGLLVLCLIAFSATSLLRQGEHKASFWINVSPLIAVFFFLVIYLGSGVEFPTRSSWEWILPKEDAGALRLSFEVTWGSALLGIAYGLALFSWIASFAFKKKPLTPGSMGGALIAYASVLASWSSNSIAFSLLGLSLAYAATTYFLQMSVESEVDTKRISLHLLPKLLGIFILFLGFTGFASSGLNLDLESKAVEWVKLDLDLSSVISAKIFIGIGFLLLLQPIPGAGALWLPTKNHSAPFSMVALIPIPLSALALLFRMETHLKTLELWTPWVSVLVGAGLFVVAAQFFQRDISGMVRNWVLLGPILTAVLLGLAGKTAAFLILLGWLFFLPVLTEVAENGRNRVNAGLLIFSGLGVMGFFGFFPAEAMIHAYATMLDRPIFLSGTILIALGSGVGLSRIVVLHLLKKKVEEKVHLSSALLFISAILLMGWLISGTWSGGFFHNQLDVVEGLKQLDWVKESVLLLSAQSDASWMNATLIHVLVLVISPLLGYFSRSVDLSRSFPKLGAWAFKGFGLDPFFQASLALGERASQWISRAVSDRVWDKAWPKTGEWSVHVLRRAFSGYEKISERMNQFSFTRIIDTPAKLVQLIQSGDSHWYLFFCVLCAFITLMHFIRF